MPNASSRGNRIHPCAWAEIRMGLDQPRHDRVSPTKEFPRFGVGNGRRTDLRLGFCHFRHSGSFLEQALGEHDLHNPRHGLLPSPVALQLGRERDPTDRPAARLHDTLEAGAMRLE